MCKLKIRCVGSHFYYVLYVTYFAIHCSTMRNYYSNLQAPVKFTIHVLAASCQYLPLNLQYKPGSNYHKQRQSYNFLNKENQNKLKDDTVNETKAMQTDLENS